MLKRRRKTVEGWGGRVGAGGAVGVRGCHTCCSYLFKVKIPVWMGEGIMRLPPPFAEKLLAVNGSWEQGVSSLQ